jgi:hypothetical protein
MLTVGCGTHVAAPAVTMAPLHRAALTGTQGASLQATFRLPARHLQHVAGAPAFTLADLNAVALYLIAAPASQPPTGVLTPVPGSGFTYTLDADNRTRAQVDVLYTHVPANLPGQAYFLAVAALGSEGNITNTAAPATISALGHCYVSDGGGDPEAPGSVRVEPVTYALSANAPLTAALKLLDAKAATLDTSVTITDGG